MPKTRKKRATTRNGVGRTVWAILLGAYVAGAPRGKGEHQASQLKAPLGWRKEKWNRAKGIFLGCIKGIRDNYMTIRCLIGTGYKQPQIRSLCQSLIPHALFINMYALVASRSIWITLPWLYQPRFLIHSPQFPVTRVRALWPIKYPSQGSPGPSTAQSHDPSNTSNSWNTRWASSSNKSLSLYMRRHRSSLIDNPSCHLRGGFLSLTAHRSSNHDNIWLYHDFLLSRMWLMLIKISTTHPFLDRDKPLSLPYVNWGK